MNMNKKKVVLFVTLTSMIAITSSVLAINGGLKNLSVFATDGEVWYHYAVVDPTETTHGSKEFWASSVDGCLTHTFTKPEGECEDRDFSKNDFFASLTYDDDRYVMSYFEERNAVYPIFDGHNTGDKVYFGLYPQKNVNDTALIAALNAIKEPESNGWYLYNKEYYAKLKATPYQSDYKFDNGTTIVSGTTYWFKCEPITWNILSNNNGEYYILSNVLLDAHCYYNSRDERTIEGETIYPDNYEYSDIHTWLNDDFYKSAFALGKNYIKTTTVDNSAVTTDSLSNPYICKNTQDKVFLPSYQDYINPSYGFSTSTKSTNTRYCRTTDWARARGSLYYTRSGSYFEYNGYYWTRSPDSRGPDAPWYVYYSGNLYSNYVDMTYSSVRPAITVEIA